MIERGGDEKRGECLFFPKLAKSMHIFPPIGLILITKLQKER